MTCGDFSEPDKQGSPPKRGPPYSTHATSCTCVGGVRGWWWVTRREAAGSDACALTGSPTATEEAVGWLDHAPRAYPHCALTPRRTLPISLMLVLSAFVPSAFMPAGDPRSPLRSPRSLRLAPPTLPPLGMSWLAPRSHVCPQNRTGCKWRQIPGQIAPQVPQGGAKLI